MKLLKVFLILLGFPSQMLFGSAKAEDQRIYIKSVRCNISEEFIYKNFSCFAKSYSRTISTINAIGFSKFPMKSINVEIKLFFKYGTIYREVLHTPVFDWCKFVEENSQDRELIINTPLTLIYKLVKDSAPSAVHKCPYTDIIVRNCTVNCSSMQSIFPTGDYKLIASFENSEGVKILTITIVGAMLTSNKDTFG